MVHDPTSKIRVAILGATGYTARELIGLLLHHPQVEITTLTTRQDSSPRLADIHPLLRGRLDLPLENLSPQEVAERADCVFSCLPHGASATIVESLLAEDCRVIDFSADYRLDHPEIYTKWYGVQHPAPERMAKTVYGLPELYRKNIPGANLVANPGCYPTAAILALAPLLKEKLIRHQGIVIDSKSGVSGAGRSPKSNLHFPECNENFSAYAVGQHRHTPEIDQILSNWATTTTSVVFTPHLVPMNRGILTTAYADPTADTSANTLQESLQRTYAGEPFVRVVKDFPGTKDVVGTNFCDITVRIVQNKVVVISVIDNLLKGASGAAVHNFNVMYGFDETTAL
jgi:N-acetyl-gamma-glutamyl-phosphate reductase